LDIKPLIGLAGVLLLALTAEFNDQVVALALPDVRGGLGLSTDPGTWFASLFVAAEVVGMAVAPWWAVTVTLRRMTLFVATLACLSTVCVPLSDNLAWLYGLRILQGLSVGLTIPLLMTTALRVLGPEIRLVGLACYAVTATFATPFAATLAALWTDVVGDWRFAFLEAIPFCTTAAALLWWGMPEEPSQLDRVRQFDVLSFVLLVVGFGSLVTALEQGDRLDWFNSQLIVVLLLVSALAIPAFLYRQWRAEIPFFRLQLLGRPNVLFGVSGLVVFLLIALSATQVPITYLEQVQGYRPLQAHLVTLEVALLQLVSLPVTALLLDRPSVDARWVAAAGLALIFTASVLDAFVNPDWNRDQFYFTQALQAFGFSFVIMPILMLVTNVIKPEEGPFASALFNTPRAVTEAIGVWLLQLIARWRGALHRERLADTLGQVRAQLESGPAASFLHAPHAPAGFAAAGRGPAGYGELIERQMSVLTLSDTFVILAGLTLVLGLLLFIPGREAPPRIALAQH
jgi:MFS transporter, DHA2 family, multidrug resistance protein